MCMHVLYTYMYIRPTLALVTSVICPGHVYGAPEGLTVLGSPGVVVHVALDLQSIRILQLSSERARAPAQARVLHGGRLHALRMLPFIGA